jgi:hypothetical protein
MTKLYCYLPLWQLSHVKLVRLQFATLVDRYFVCKCEAYVMQM